MVSQHRMLSLYVSMKDSVKVKQVKLSGIVDYFHLSHDYTYVLHVQYNMIN